MLYNTYHFFLFSLLFFFFFFLVYFLVGVVVDTKKMRLVCYPSLCSQWRTWFWVAVVVIVVFVIFVAISVAASTKDNGGKKKKKLFEKKPWSLYTRTCFQVHMVAIIDRQPTFSKTQTILDLCHIRFIVHYVIYYS